MILISDLYIIPALPGQKMRGVIFMKKNFGILPTGEETYLYTISAGGITATVTDYGANLVNLYVPDRNGVIADVVLGYDDCNGYRTANGAFLGAIVGRNANRIAGASFMMVRHRSLMSLADAVLIPMASTICLRVSPSAPLPAMPSK